MPIPYSIYIIDIGPHILPNSIIFSPAYKISPFGMGSKEKKKYFFAINLFFDKNHFYKHFLGHTIFLTQLSKPQLNHNSTQPNITLSWVRHENDFAHHPPTHTNAVSAISQQLLTRF